jgi:hypothetical protein
VCEGPRAAQAGLAAEVPRQQLECACNLRLQLPCGRTAVAWCRCVYRSKCLILVQAHGRDVAGCWRLARLANAPLIAEYPDEVEVVELAEEERVVARLRVMQSLQWPVF